MNAVLILSIVIRVVAFAWSLVVMRRIRDWRMAFLSLMLALMAVRQILTLRGDAEPGMTARELPGLLVSILGLHAVFLLERVLTRGAGGDRDKLVRSRERVLRLIETGPHGIQESDPEGTITFSNAAHAGIYGCESLVGTRIWDNTVTPEEADGLREYLAFLVKEQPPPEPFFTRGKRLNDGRVVDVRVDWDYIRDESGTLLGFGSIITDVTEVKRAEAALKESEAHFRALIDNTQDVISVLNADGTFRFVSPSVGRILGHDPEALTGTPFAAYLHPEDIPTTAETIRTAIAEPGTVQRNRSRVRHADGTWRLLESLGSATLSADGELRIMISSRDVTDRQRAEEEQRLLSTAVEQAAEAIMITSPDGSIEYVNPAFLRSTGYSLEEVLSRNPEFLNAGRLPESHYEELWRTIRQGRIWEGRFVNRRKDGSVFVEEAAISPVLDPDGAITHFVAVKRDVTREIRMEEQLRQAQKMEALGQLAGGIAHDFNNVLMPILGYTSQVRAGLDPDSQDHADLVQVEQAAHRARELVRQILAFSRRGETDRLSIDLSGVVAEVLQLMSATLPSSIEIHRDVEAGVGRVLADSTQMHQVLLNLCTNAAHAMRDAGGVLEVGLHGITVDERLAGEHPDLDPGEGWVCLSVTDTGHGMDASTRDRVFEPFFTTKQVGEGTGLGLSVIHGIVTAHGGRILVDSEPSRGSTFRVLLPSAGIPDPDRPVPAGGALGGDERVLIVDDEPAIVGMAANMLSRRGYRVTPITSPEEALKRFAAEPDGYDVVVTDQTMPRMLGTDLVRELHAVRGDVPVILMTGYSTVIHGENYRDYGVARLLGKPVLSEDLARAIRDAVDGA